jgi:maleate isomerase
MKEMFQRNLDQGAPLRGALSGRTFVVPNANPAPMPDLVPPGVILNRHAAPGFGTVNRALGYPDVQSFRRKFALLVPATNTAMEAELWRLLIENASHGGLDAGPLAPP